MSLLHLIADDRVWAGTQQNLDATIDILAQANVSALSSQDQADSQDVAWLKKDGNLGVISIKGPLVNSDSPYAKYFGVVTYNDLRTALVTAAEDLSIQNILLDVGSGGGSAAGMIDLGKLIRQIHNNVKPVYTFTDSFMMSAAYGLGVSAGKVYASSTAGVGSIGTIMVHKEMSAANKTDGVGVTVLREGKFKALASSYEKLTPEAEAQLRAGMVAVNEAFGQHVADMRSVSYPTMDSQMGQGREFWGAQAKNANLVDEITTYDELVKRLLNKTIDSSYSIAQNNLNLQTGDTMRKVLNENEAALLAARVAAGANVDDAGAAAAAGSAAAATAEETAAAEAAAATAAAAAASAEATAAAEVAASQAAATDTNAVVAYLQMQVRERDTQVMDLRVELASLQSRASQLDTLLPTFCEIVARNINTMQVALGGSETVKATDDAAVLLQAYKGVSATFADKFPVGGVAGVDAAVKGNIKPASNGLRTAQLSAVRAN